MATVFQTLTFLVLFQILFISLFLITSKKGRPLSNYLLTFFFLSLGVGLLDYFFFISGFFDQRTQYAFILNSLVIFHAPLLLLYSQSLTSPSFKLKPLHLLHAVPYLIIMVLLIIFYYSQPTASQEWTLEDVRRGKDFTNIMISVFGLVYELVYLLAIKLTIKNYRNVIKEQFSNINSINLSWLNFLVNVFMISFSASTVANVIRHSPIEHLDKGAIIVGLVGLLFFINMVLLKGLHQNEIFLGTHSKPTNK